MKSISKQVTRSEIESLTTREEIERGFKQAREDYWEWKFL